MATITNASDKSNEFLTARVRSQVVDIDGTGGTGTIADGDVVKTGLFAPEGAIVTKITYFVITALTGSGSSAGTIKMGFDADSGDDNVLAATALTSMGTAGMHGTLVGYGAIAGIDNVDTQIERTAAHVGTALHITENGGDELVFTMGGSQNCSAGKLILFMEYYQTTDLA